MAEDASKAEQLEALAQQARACSSCRLAETRTKVVFGDGCPDTPLVFVGEGPGEREDATGIPFVGRAGQLLDECMAECRLSRKHVYICNTVKCRACIVEGQRRRNRPPAPDEIAACNPWLDRQLDILKPLVILCLGAPAANTLVHSGFRMLRERGQWFDTCRYARYVSASLHPAYILRQGGPGYDQARGLLVQDIEAARRKVIEARKEQPKALF